jgi:predicted RNA-binding Zn-ribbon protein involved in translation (DUF1610 family)
MKYKKETYKNKRCNDSFICVNCGNMIHPASGGTKHRNHCPYCLFSKHLDELPGDRAAVCQGSMEAISIWVKENGEWAIVHRCHKCGKLSVNRIALDDSEEKLISLAEKPMAVLPFPVKNLKKEGEISEQK